MFPSRSTTLRYVVSLPPAILRAYVRTSRAPYQSICPLLRPLFRQQRRHRYFLSARIATYFAMSAYANFFASIIACSALADPNPNSLIGNVSMMFNISKAAIPCPFAASHTLSSPYNVVENRAHHSLEYPARSSVVIVPL